MDGWMEGCIAQDGLVPEVGFMDGITAPPILRALSRRVRAKSSPERMIQGKE